MSHVRMLDEGEAHLAYFLDTRRLVEVDEVGALVIDRLFNHGDDVIDIIARVASEYEEPIEVVRSDVTEFMTQLEHEMVPVGFSVMDQRQLSVPLGVELEITTACNLRCKHCIQTDAHFDNNMPLHRVEFILDTLSAAGVCEVSLMGGEPFKHPDIMSIIEYAHGADMAVNVVTNATLLDEERIRALATYPRLSMLVSLDGIGEVHDNIRGKNVFRRVDQKLRLMKQHGVAVDVLFTLNALNVEHYMDVVEYCDRLGIPCNFNIFKPFHESHRHLALSSQQYFDVLVNLFNIRSEGTFKIGLSNAAITADLMGLPERNECRATRSGIVVDVNERLVTCPSLVAAGYYDDKELPKFDENFLDVWRSHGTFQSFRNCGLRECQARAFISTGDVTGKDPYGISEFRKYQS